MGMHKARAKTNVWNIGSGKIPSDVFTPGQMVEPVRLTYMSCDDDSSSHSSPNVHRQTELASSTYAAEDIRITVSQRPRTILGTFGVIGIQSCIGRQLTSSSRPASPSAECTTARPYVTKQRLGLLMKLRVYKTCVLLVLPCSSEAETLLNEDGERLQAIHLR